MNTKKLTYWSWNIQQHGVRCWLCSPVIFPCLVTTFGEWVMVRSHRMQCGDVLHCIRYKRTLRRRLSHYPYWLLVFFGYGICFYILTGVINGRMYVHIIRHNFHVTLIWSDLTLYIIRLHKSKSFVMLHALHCCAVCCVAFHSWRSLVSLRTIYLSQSEVSWHTRVCTVGKRDLLLFATVMGSLDLL